MVTGLLECDAGLVADHPAVARALAR